MGCHVIGASRCCLDKQIPWSACKAKSTDQESINLLKCNVTPLASRIEHLRLANLRGLTVKQPMRRIVRNIYAMHILEEESPSLQSDGVSSSNARVPKNSMEDHCSQPLSSDELKLLLSDSERTRLLKKLSEANQQNRFLTRQRMNWVSSKVNLLSWNLKCRYLFALTKLAEEIAQYGIPVGSRKINGKYIQSHLLSRLAAVSKKLKEQIGDVVAVQSKEVPLSWSGMAESVQVMGNFDGWSQGEHLSPEYIGSFTKFSTTLMLRPGRYEIKFLIDGEWYLSPEFPTIGEGLTKNNLLIVE